MRDHHISDSIATRETEEDRAFQTRPPRPAGRTAGHRSRQRRFRDAERITVEELRLEDLERPNLKAGTLRVDGSVLERVRLPGGQFGALLMKDVRLIGCDLANVRAHRMSLVRVELVDCRMTGFMTTAVECQEVLIQNGDLGYAQLGGAKFKHCEFTRCKLEDADLQKADLTGCQILSCSLSRADLRGAKLLNTDLRKSELEGIIASPDDLHGVIIEPAQAIVLARIFGLQVL